MSDQIFKINIKNSAVEVHQCYRTSAHFSEGPIFWGPKTFRVCITLLASFLVTATVTTRKMDKRNTELQGMAFILTMDECPSCGCLFFSSLRCSQKGIYTYINWLLVVVYVSRRSSLTETTLLGTNRDNRVAKAAFLSAKKRDMFLFLSTKKKHDQECNEARFLSMKH